MAKITLKAYDLLVNSAGNYYLVFYVKDGIAHFAVLLEKSGGVFTSSIGSMPAEYTTPNKEIKLIDYDDAFREKHKRATSHIEFAKIIMNALIR